MLQTRTFEILQYQNLRVFHQQLDDPMTDDFFRARIDGMIDLKHPLAVLAHRLPWQKMQERLAVQFAHKVLPVQQVKTLDLLGESLSVRGGVVSNAGRPRLNMRLMIALTLLKNSLNLSDESLVQQFSENLYHQYFAGYDYFDPRPPCDATQIGRFRTAIGEAGLEEILSATIHTAVDLKAIKKEEFERVIVDTTVQEKAIAHPVDSRLLDIARRKVVRAAKGVGIVLKQTFEREAKSAWLLRTNKVCWWGQEAFPATPTMATFWPHRWSKAPFCCKT